MTNPLAKKTIRRINEALDKNETGALAEVVQTVRRLSGRIAHVSVTELADIIAQDPTIMEKVISAANTFGYNPSGVDITTISEAIHTVGFERIRNLTLSLMLAEGAGKALNNVEQREMAALSVCSGMLAENLIQESISTSIDPELAFVSASLRNYGKLLMSTFFLDEYLDAKDKAARDHHDQAYVDAFGLTPLELGHTLLKSTSLPEIIIASLERVSQEALSRSSQTQSEELIVAAEFCVQICEIAFDETLEPDAFESALNKTIQRFSESMPVDIDIVKSGLETVDETLAQLNQIVGISDDASMANKKLRARIAGRPVPKIERPRSKKRNTMTTLVNGSEVTVEYESVGDVLTRLEANPEKVNLEEIFESINAAIAGSLGLESCMSFICDDDREREKRFSARHGIGKLFGRIRNRPLISSEKKDLFGICLNRKEDIFIQDTQSGKIASVIPDWIHYAGEVKSMIVLPAATDGKMFAIFIGTTMEDSLNEVEPEVLRQLRQLRGKLAALMRDREQGAAER